MRTLSWLAVGRILATSASLAGAGVAGAQTIRGTVVERDERPVAGVVVLLVDSASNIAARALSNERGEFRLSNGTAGTFRMRTMRIGFRSTTSEPMTLHSGEEIAQRLVLSGLPLALDTIRVVGRTLCSMRADSSTAPFAVWEQVRTALTATQLSARDRAMAVTTVTYERSLDPGGRRILEQSTNVLSEFVTQPWRSISPDSARRVGYVVTGDEWTTYYAPGLVVLLSDVFIEDHCFRLRVDGDRLGVMFEPSPNRKRIPEIKGTIWLGRRSAELRTLEFRYVNIAAEAEGAAGGDMEFVRMRNGTWAISRWSIRMPVLERVVRAQSLGGIYTRIAEIRVHGGDLAVVRRNSDTLWWRPVPGLSVAKADSAPATRIVELRPQTASTLPLPAQRVAVFQGSVLGEKDRQPLADAEVALPALERRVQTASGGTFTIRDIPAGTHQVVVRRVGYQPFDEQVPFATGETVERRIVLRPVVTLDSVMVNESITIPSLDEHRKLGLGRFLTRADLAKNEGRRMSEILSMLPNARVIRGRGNHAWLATNHRPAQLDRRDITDSAQGAVAGACYAQVYLDRALVYRGARPIRPGAEAEPLFDINGISASQVEALEYYASPAETPFEYNSRNSEGACGVLVIWTRRSP